jgi:hypothetical protein
MFEAMNAQLPADSARLAPGMAQGARMAGHGAGHGAGRVHVIPKPAGDPPRAPPANVPLPTRPTAPPRGAAGAAVGRQRRRGQALANASTMALMDMNASNLRITTYDTSQGAPAAAARALADGNRLILGPLLGEEAGRGAAARRRVPVISFSNDYTVAGDEVFVMGTIPAQSINRVVRYARRGRQPLCAGPAGHPASGHAAMVAGGRGASGGAGGMETWPRSGGIGRRRAQAEGAWPLRRGADRRHRRHGARPRPWRGKPGRAFWAPNGRRGFAGAQSGAAARSVPPCPTRISASPPAIARFGDAPYRISTMGYDSVLLTCAWRA